MDAIICYVQERAGVGRVNRIIHNPAGYEPEQDERFIEYHGDLPHPEEIFDLQSVLMVNLTTNELYYDYATSDYTLNNSISAKVDRLTTTVNDLTLILTDLLDLE